MTKKKSTLKFDDLTRISEKELQDFTNKYFMKGLDVHWHIEHWCALSYYYAKKEGLKEYQARSFATVLTAFLTNKVIHTGVEQVYKESDLDSFLYDKYKLMEDKAFVEYLLLFYKSRESWKYERKMYNVNFRLNQKEWDLLESVPVKRKHDKFLYLIDLWNERHSKYVNVEHSSPLSRVYYIRLSISEYEYFMQVAGDGKTDKFLNMLYNFKNFRK